jgi:uncharacterized Zn finger protein
MKRLMNNMPTPILYIPRNAQHEADNDQWTNRFKIKSESSNRLYVIAQNKQKRHWACSCPGWKSHRTCKHLSTLALPAYEKPYEVQISGR